MSRIELALSPRSHVTFAPQRQALILSPDRLAPGVAEALRSQGLRLVAAGQPAGADRAHYAEVLPRRPDRLTGWLGHFQAWLSVQGEEEDLGVFSARKDNLWDWVIDASEAPWFTDEVRPLGYLHLPQGALTPELQAALAQASDGEIRHPVYIQYRAERCAHSSKGVEGCTLCLEGCPAGALRSENGGIVVQAELCHGCGLCAARCPTGAIRYDYPTLNGVLSACLEALYETGNAPDLTLRIAGQGDAELTTSEGTRDLVLPSATSFGPELWLALLAMGWARVVLDTRGLPSSTQTLLSDQIRHWNSLLDAPRIVDARDTEALSAKVPARTLMALPETYRTWPGDKRRLISQSLARLLKHDDAFITRSTGFPLGKVVINDEACTQCRACAQVCPTDALAETEDPVALQFTATQCAQCGICEAACPEHAIRLEPGLELNPERRDNPQTLFEVDMARCSRCGAPIMAAGVIESLRKKLGEDVSVNLEVLELCQACRVDEMFGFPAPEPDD